MHYPNFTIFFENGCLSESMQRQIPTQRGSKGSRRNASIGQQGRKQDQRNFQRHKGQEGLQFIKFVQLVWRRSGQIGGGRKGQGKWRRRQSGPFGNTTQHGDFQHLLHRHLGQSGHFWGHQGWGDRRHQNHHCATRYHSSCHVVHFRTGSFFDF